MLVRVFIGICLVVTMIGCAAKGPQFSQVEIPTNENVHIYIYRPWVFTGSGMNVTMYDSGVRLTPDLSPGSYMLYSTVPGMHKIHTDEAMMINRELFLNTEPGKVYFVRIDIKHYFAVAAFEANAVDMQTALEGVKECRLAL